MRAVWATEDAVCVHPGAVPLLGYESVMRSWAHIFEGAETPLIETRVIQRIVSDEMAVHLVEERVSTASAPGNAAVVMATNIYRVVDGVWRMVVHHGSMAQVRDAPKPTLQ